ncbi:uncharacterized protein KY384_001462 [Bacidia gigantensis]|uniref:uncharacterized protein n=1 Tax=Bacidia gigantensis TaxID=2732470 RepID=UPI001D04B0C7|nr:uncharacterized protein KY384_001462 [Bacidia gigantensis]KAG8533721.1 hypothetical protein KY384_001462 [Bacidia gigantensis]
MPLDTSLYPLTLLRPDGRRWNELRRLHAQISTQSAADGSAYLEMGNTKILCIVTGPNEPRGGGQQRREGRERDEAQIHVEINQAGFAGTDRKKRGKGDRRLMEMGSTIASAMATACFLNLFPHSTVHVTLHVLSVDGPVLAPCINATTLALIDAGIPTRDYVCACTCGLSPLAPGVMRREGESQDPLLDLNGMEEMEVPFLTVATLGEEGDKVVVLNMERRVRMEAVEGMLATGIEGCRRVRGLLDQVVRERGGAVIAAGSGT